MDTNNKKLAKNTGMLYFRMIFLTLINLYAVRVTFNALGEIDYGVYNVVAGVVASLSILTGAMTSASQRFLAFHLGKNDLRSYSHTFSLLLLAFISISVVLIIVGESAGYFFVEKWLDIPTDRIPAARWVYQTALVGFVFSFITIPYNASIVANERMDAFAAFSIVEGVMKLGAAIWIVQFGGDRLILYGILIASISIVVFLMSMQFCHLKFRYCRYIWKWDKAIFMQLSGYTGWNLFGSISGMLSNQGQTVLLNIYFGPAVNAAKAIADRILQVVQSFSVNIYMAAGPQIIKAYAGQDMQRALKLVLTTSRLTFLMVYAVSFPVICNVKSILDFWMGTGNVSTVMMGFSQLVLIYCMVFTLEQPITRIIQATGEIKRYQLKVGIITLMYIPLAVTVLSLGASPVMTLVVQITVIAVAQCVRVMVAHRQIGLRYGVYMSDVVYPIARVALVSLPLYWAMKDAVLGHGWYGLALNVALTGLMGLFIAVMVGLKSGDRAMIWNLVRRR